MTRDRLDDAIDSVAARLTCVTEDEGLALRIMKALPARSAWSIRWLMPRLAMTAALGIGVALVVLRTLNTNVPTKVQHEGSAQGFSTRVQTEVQTGVQAGVLANVPNDRLNDRVNLRVNDRLNPRVNDRVTDRDHDFSLPAIASPEALSVSVLASESLPVEDALSLAPLEIADLPLTAETISPR